MLLTACTETMSSVFYCQEVRVSIRNLGKAVGALVRVGSQQHRAVFLVMHARCAVSLVASIDDLAVHVIALINCSFAAS